MFKYNVHQAVCVLYKHRLVCVALQVPDTRLS